MKHTTKINTIVESLVISVDSPNWTKEIFIIIFLLRTSSDKLISS
jgi:hypothetical protein